MAAGIVTADARGVAAVPTAVEVILKSLTASAEFMSMAVNRGIEFAKASGGIKLKVRVWVWVWVGEAQGEGCVCG